MGVTLGIVQILWQIYMLTLFIKGGLPGKQTRAFHSLLHPLLFFILFRSYYHPPFLRVCVCGGGKGFFSEFRQPTQSGFLEKGSPCEPLVFRRHLCFLSLGQVAHPLPESSSLPSTGDSMWFPGLPHQAAGHSQPGPPSLGKGSGCLVFGVLVLCGFGVCPTADIFPLE